MLSVQPNQPPVVGDRYQLIGTIDHRGTTWQYLGWDSAENRWCTVRMLGFSHVRDPMARARFERQVHQLERVSHPNVLAVYSADSAHPTHPWVATAVAEGGSIADWMSQNGTLPHFLAIDVMAHVCNGLAASHAAGVTHGNIRPEHVLIDRHGMCMITGLRGGSERGDQQADLKGAGSLLYTMLTGEYLDERNAAGQLAALPTPIARAIEQTRRLRGGFANVAQLSRELEAGVLELPPPTGTVPPLAGPDAALLNDPWSIWNPDTAFPDLAHLANLGADPSYQPAEAYAPPETPLRPVTPIPPAPEPEQVLPAKKPANQRLTGGYPMSRAPAGPANRAATGATNYDKPLYQEPARRDREAIDLGLDLKPKKSAVEEETPVISEFVLLRLIALSLALAIASSVAFTLFSIQTVSVPRTAAEASAAQLVDLVRRESSVVYDLAHQGGDQAKLEAAYFEFSEARNEIVRVQKGLAFAKLVHDEAEAEGLTVPGAAGTEIAQRVSQITNQYADTMAKRDQWAKKSSHFPGSFSVAIGLQYGPPY